MKTEKLSSSPVFQGPSLGGVRRPSLANRRALLGLSLLLAVFGIGRVQAGPVTVTGISGAFSSPVLTGDVIEPFGPPTFFDNALTAEYLFEAGGAIVRWGNVTPTPGFGTSALGFLGSVPPAPVAEGEEFPIGLVLFANGSSELDTLIFGADLTIAVAASAGGPVDDLLSNIGIYTTRNGYGAAFDADFVTISGMPSPVSLHAYEGSLVQATLYGKFVGDPMLELTSLVLLPGEEANGFIGDGTAPAAVPEPSSLALLGLSALALGFARRRKSRR